MTDVLERAWVRWLVVWGVVFVVALLLDRWAYRVTYKPELAGEDWVQVLRQMGYLPTWLLIALLILLHDRRRGGPGSGGGSPGGLAAPQPPRPRHHRAGLVLLSALFSGLAANILKPLLGRLRPDAEGIGRWAERPAILWADGGDIGLGLPSGHSAVAVGGCWMLALLWPAWRWPMLGLAAGCALTRLFAGAHLLSDTVLAAGVATAIAAWLHATGEGPRRGPAGGLVPR